MAGEKEDQEIYEEEESMSKRVYLAGPITGLDYEGASDWRGWVWRQLFTPDTDIECFSPMRGKPRLKELGEISGTAKEYQHMGAFYEPKGIVTRDRHDCTTADMILMNLLGSKQVSVGSMVELGWASAHDIPVVIVMEPDNIHRHVFTEQLAGFVVGTLAEGVEIVKGVLLP